MTNKLSEAIAYYSDPANRFETNIYIDELVKAARTIEMLENYVRNGKRMESVMIMFDNKIGKIHCSLSTIDRIGSFIEADTLPEAIRAALQAAPIEPMVYPCAERTMHKEVVQTLIERIKELEAALQAAQVPADTIHATPEQIAKLNELMAAPPKELPNLRELMTGEVPADRAAALDALNRLLNDALSSRDGYGDAHKDAALVEAALMQGGVAQCQWEHSGDEGYKTGCGEMFLFFDGGPKENNVKNCPYCGGTITEAPQPPREGE